MLADDLSLTALDTVIAETTAAFDWLTEGLDRGEPVSFVPNPGNVGDAAINLGCFSYLAQRFDNVAICSMGDAPRTECVFLGGGGNAVEPLYDNVRDFLDRLAPGHRLFLFPATIRGYASTLERIAAFSRILCREPKSLAYVATLLRPANAALAHDAAFLLGPRLRHEFASRLARTVSARCRSFRNDQESICSEQSGIDITGQYQGAWTDMRLADENVRAVARYLLGFGEVETDRLHCAIIAAMLGRRTVLRANSYYKNAAVFEHSLSRFPNTTFVPAG
jgi:exopolysaccharide biosynthesis predicted pyruvyltransferase EpsI